MKSGNDNRCEVIVMTKENNKFVQEIIKEMIYPKMMWDEYPIKLKHIEEAILKSRDKTEQLKDKEHKEDMEAAKRMVRKGIAELKADLKKSNEEKMEYHDMSAHRDSIIAKKMLEIQKLKQEAREK